MFFVYSLLMALAVAITSPYWIVQGLRRGKNLSNLGERLGFSLPDLRAVNSAPERAIWIHAVSVGEAISGIPLAKRLKQDYPRRPLVISTTTTTGFALAKERMPFADAIIYFPFDWAFCVRRVMDAVRPGMVIILETEIWPNFLREARKRSVPVLFVSGRISDRSYQRYQKAFSWFGFYLKPLIRAAVNDATAFLMQTPRDAERVIALGAPRERVSVSGNLKYDMDLPSATSLSQWLGQECKRGNRWPIIVAGSVVATEEPLALIAFGVVQGDFPKALLVLAPRKPERFGPAAEFISESHRKFVRRSELQVPGPGTNGAGTRTDIPEDCSVLLLDSIGELASLYPLADGVFVGGSLVPSGGHNILEPAAFGKIPVFGDSMENFSEIAKRFVEAGAAIQVGSPEDAGVEWIRLLKDPATSRQMGDAARNLVENSRGSLDRVLTEVRRHLDGPSK